MRNQRREKTRMRLGTRRNASDDPQRWKCRQYGELMTERRAEVKQAGRAMVGLVVMMMIIMIGIVVMIVVVIIMIIVTGNVVMMMIRVVIVVMVFVQEDDRVADVNVIGVMKRLVQRRYADGTAEEDRDRADRDRG